MDEKEHVNDRFKKSFKFYKRRKPPPDLSAVIDFSNTNDDRIEPFHVDPTRSNDKECVTLGSCGLRALSEWSAYTLRGIPGFCFINNPFVQGAQAYWVKRCLADYPTAPNVTNLENLPNEARHENIWEESVQYRNQRKLRMFDRTPVFRLRWATLGYHHDWDSKVYSKEKVNEMPDDLSTLSNVIASAVGYPEYKGEAAIINYYHLDSTLSGHTDHSEVDHKSPLISVSFGQSAVFLLGGPTKETEPLAMFIRSGDIVIMWDESRLNYHAVPRVLDTGPELCDINYLNSDVLHLTKEEKLDSDTTDENRCSHDVLQTLETLDWEPFAVYLKNSRINMNVRQVLPSCGS